MRHLSRTAHAVAALALFALPHIAVAQSGPGQPPQGEFIAGPLFSPDGQRVLFSYATSMSQPWQVHSIRIDGTDQRPLTTGPYFAGPVAFSPDGKRLVYRLTNRDARGMLPQDRALRMTRYMSSNPDGTDPRELLSATGTQASFGGWGPGGVGAVFTTRTAGGALGSGAESTFVVAIDGSQQRLIPHAGFWLRDGRVVSTSSNATGATIMIADRDGSNSRPLTTEVRFQRQPVASPDGKRIAFLGSTVPPAGPQSLGLHLYVANTDGTDLHQVVADAARAYNFSFSPDGTRLLFEDTRADNGDIYIVDAEGRNERRLTADPGRDELPSWSPDGTRIVFHSVREGRWGIYLVNADGTGTRRLR